MGERPGASLVLLLVLAAFNLAASGTYLHSSWENSLGLTVTELCLGCMCEATCNCNLTVGCMRDLCGPLLISPAYWRLAGSPSVPPQARITAPRGSTDYERCVHDPACAAVTVKNYVGRYIQDCNQDGQFDCEDVARIHYLGGSQCHLKIEHTGYYRVFRQCMDNVKLFIGKNIPL